jgi:hypothetical protein
MRLPQEVVALAILLSAGVATAGSQPVVTGQVEGMETCAQFSCGFAQFLGTSQLQIGTTQGKGGFLVQVTHGPVPLLPGGTAPISGGQWAMSANQTVFSGAVEGGLLVNNGNNTFTVTLTLLSLSGASGTLSFTGILDHNTFPPTIAGIVAQ